MIAENIENIKVTLPQGVKLVAVSKLKPVEDIMEAYRAGQRAFGENYATELRDKAAVLPKDIEWHFVGHLQSKQLKYYIPFVSLIHGVDSEEHLRDVDQAAAKAGRTVDVLLQLHVAQEETKFGFSPEELLDFQFSIFNFQFVRVRGLMAMATNTTDIERVRDDFRRAHTIFVQLKETVFRDSPCFDQLSMGMSHDYQLAIEEGSTMVRLGTSIFGPRDYSKKDKNQ